MQRLSLGFSYVVESTYEESALGRRQKLKLRQHRGLQLLARSAPWRCARARRGLSSVTAGLRPPVRPCAAAAAKPVRVRSWIRLRSDCPGVADRWNTGRPPGDVDRFGEQAEPHSAWFQRGHGLDQVRQAAPEPIQFPDDQHLAVAHAVERSPQARAVGAGAGGTVLGHLGASGSRQGVKLECEVLVQRAHPRIANVCQGRPCPFSRPAINLSAFPSAVQGWRTDQGWPVRVGLTDSTSSGRRSSCRGARWPICTASWSQGLVGAPHGHAELVATQVFPLARFGRQRSSQRRFCVQPLITNPHGQAAVTMVS